MLYLERYIKGESGVAAIEFSLLVPVFVLMLVGTLDVGMYIVERMQLQNAVQRSANYVARTADDANLQYVFQEGYQGDGGDVTVTSEFVCMCSDGEDQECPVSCGGDDYQRRYVEVTAQASYDPLFIYPGIGDSITMQRNARVRVD